MGRLAYVFYGKCEDHGRAAHATLGISRTVPLLVLARNDFSIESVSGRVA
jgi:hypothetical protein